MPVSLSSCLYRASICARCQILARRTPTRLKSSNTSRATNPPPKPTSPIDDYYSLLLAQPLPVNAAHSSPSSAAVAPTQSTTSSNSVPKQPTTPEERARVVFGSRLAGPGVQEEREKRLSEAKLKGEGQWLAGVWIPPKPSEPDNCCMSGCVNCVWDGYREELEDWVGLRKEARTRHSKAKSMDDDGGGSDTLWNEGETQSMDILFEAVPVGIREFMKTEKRLAENKRLGKEQARTTG